MTIFYEAPLIVIKEQVDEGLAIISKTIVIADEDIINFYLLRRKKLTIFCEAPLIVIKEQVDEGLAIISEAIAIAGEEVTS